VGQAGIAAYLCALIVPMVAAFMAPDLIAIVWHF